MKSKPMLVLEDVKKIVAAAEAEARANGWNVSIAVTDDGGHLLSMLRLDGASPLSSAIAIAKANCSALGKRETKFYEQMINGERTAFVTFPLVEGMVEGGIPIFLEGQCLGAIGVSGVKSNQDAQIAQAGIAALLI